MGLQRAVVLSNVEIEIELRIRAGDHLVANLQSIEAQRVPRLVVQVEHHLEEWRAARIARWLKLLDEPFERYLRRLYEGGGRTNDFRKLRRRLFVVATNLNTGEAARFGEPGLDHVPISRAVQASTALPGLYSPVEIDGETYADGALLRTMHASVLLEAGVDLVFGINPLVPFDASEDRAGPREIELTDHGLPIVLGQTFRALIRSRMQVGVAAYGDRFPRSEILLLEPDRGDRRMFFANVFRYADRRKLVDHAFECTRRDLRLRAVELAPVLARHGLRLNRAALADPSHRFQAPLERQRRADRRVIRDLGSTLIGWSGSWPERPVQRRTDSWR